MSQAQVESTHMINLASGRYHQLSTQGRPPVSPPDGNEWTKKTKARLPCSQANQALHAAAVHSARLRASASHRCLCCQSSGNRGPRSSEFKNLTKLEQLLPHADRSPASDCQSSPVLVAHASNQESQSRCHPVRGCLKPPRTCCSRRHQLWSRHCMHCDVAVLELLRNTWPCHDHMLAAANWISEGWQHPALVS